MIESFSYLLAQPCTQSLETLNLGHNSVGNEGVHKLKDGLISNRSVLRLGLASTKLSCEGRQGVSVPLLIFHVEKLPCIFLAFHLCTLSSVLQELWLSPNLLLRVPDCCVLTFERTRSRQEGWWLCRWPWKSTHLCCVLTWTESPRKKPWAWEKWIQNVYISLFNCSLDQRWKHKKVKVSCNCL